MASPDPVPTTMRSLAIKLRLSTMTVSRALRNAAGVSAATRQRVVDEARRMHYRPDPSLAVLNNYRHRRRRAFITERLAFLTNFSTAEGWRYSLTFVRYFEGARHRARQLGYELDPFWLGTPGLTPRRASQILHQRGVRGLIIGPLALGRSVLSLNWDLFSAVSVGRSLEAPGLTTVSINHFQALELAWREVWQRGYRRIGLAITEGEDARTAGALRASYLLQQTQSIGDRLPILHLPEFSGTAVTAWVNTHQPDALLSSEQSHYDLLEKAGTARTAAKPRFVHLNVDPSSDLTGIDQGHDIVGEQAAALLHLKLIQRETGVPARRNLWLIHGVWKQGRGAWALQRQRLTKRAATSGT